MRIRKLFATVVAITGAVSLLAGTAVAANSVSIDTVGVAGGVATVTGTASFDPITGPQSVGGTATEFGNADVANATGLNLTDGKIAPLADGSGLRFIWDVTNLPATGVIPEGVRYTFSFRIGQTQYQLQAKSSNLASVTTTENPVGHARQVGKNFFQLRGACTTSYEGLPSSGCYHLAFLNGQVDVAGKRISMDMPYNTKDNIGRHVAPDFQPGAVLVENQTAGFSIAACYQAVLTIATVCDYINGWNPYFVGPQVQLGVGPAGADPAEVAFGSAATLTGGSFSGTVGGLDEDNNTVYARACNGVSCAHASATP